MATVSGEPRSRSPHMTHSWMASRRGGGGGPLGGGPLGDGPLGGGPLGGDPLGDAGFLSGAAGGFLRRTVSASETLGSPSLFVDS
jgi:hypothetical protein